MEPPPRPLLLHDLAAPYILLWAALMVPHRALAAALFLPLIARSCLTLLHASSPSPPASYLAGAFAVYHALTALNLLVLRDPRTEFRRLPPADPHDPHPHPQPHEGEPYPRNLLHRAAWTLDLLASMRALHWSHNPHATAPPLPPADALSRTVFLRRRAARLLALYAFLDTAMFTMQHLDRGFFLPPGHARSPATSSTTTYSTTSSPSSHPALTAARRILTGTLIYAVLNGAYTLLSLLSVLAGALSGDCRTGWRRAWLHWRSWPDAFGHWRSGHWGGGVAGLWTRAWHGLFKGIFVAPGRWAVGGRGGGSGGWVAGGVRLVGPFVASAALHFGGAWTLARGRGMGWGWGSAGFFLWQPVGVGVEGVVRAWMGRRGWGGWPRWVGCAAPYVWVGVWLVVTSGGFFDELRYGGMWVMQPLPVSVWRWAAGAGGAWCWGPGEGGRGWWEWDESLGGWGVRI